MDINQIFNMIDDRYIANNDLKTQEHGIVSSSVNQYTHIQSCILYASEIALLYVLYIKSQFIFLNLSRIVTYPGQFASWNHSNASGKYCSNSLSASFIQTPYVLYKFVSGIFLIYSKIISYPGHYAFFSQCNNS